MEQKHTPEPWSIDQYRSIKTASGEVLLLGGVATPMTLGDNMREGWANARRIVACVNACRGFSIEELDGADIFRDSIEAMEKIDMLTKQRDQLLAALKKAKPTLEMYRAYGWDDRSGVIREVDAAIAAVKDELRNA